MATNAIRKAYQLARELGHTWGRLGPEQVEELTSTATSLVEAVAAIDRHVHAGGPDEFGQPFSPGPCGWGITSPTLLEGCNDTLVHETGTGRARFLIDDVCTTTCISRPGCADVVQVYDVHSEEEFSEVYIMGEQVCTRHLAAAGLLAPDGGPVARWASARVYWAWNDTIVEASPQEVLAIARRNDVEAARQALVKLNSTLNHLGWGVVEKAREAIETLSSIIEES